MSCKYPNLELLEYQFKEILMKSKSFKEKRDELQSKYPIMPLEFNIVVFPQVWGSTCTAFDVNENGGACMGGCAMTKAYTVVIEEMYTKIYGVFVNDRFCYLVSDPTVAFYTDLDFRNMAPISEATLKY